MPVAKPWGQLGPISLLSCWSRGELPGHGFTPGFGAAPPWGQPGALPSIPSIPTLGRKQDSPSDPPHSIPPNSGLPLHPPCRPPAPLPVVSSWLRQALGTSRWGGAEGPGILFAFVPPGFAFGRPPLPWGSPLGGTNLGSPSRAGGRTWGVAGPGYPRGTMPAA